MKRYTPEELSSIFAAIAPSSGLLVPMSYGQPSRASGPAVCVYLRYSEIIPEARDVESRYWTMLRRTPVIPGIGMLAWINKVLSEHRADYRNVHRNINQRLLTTELMAKVASREVAGPGFACVFNRIGCLQLIRHLIVYGNASLKLTAQNEKDLGELVLLTNHFLQFDAAPTPSQLPTLDLLVSTLPVWDVYNPRDLAYALSRMYTILTEILPGNDPEVRRLASKLGIDTSRIMVGNLPLNDFIAAVFGLFAYGRQFERPDHALFDVRSIFAKVGFPPGILRKLIRDRALTAFAFRQRLSGKKPHTRKSFVEELASRSFVTGSLNVFRQVPLLKLDANRVLILDLEFLAGLLTSGVYWTIFDNLPANRRETFRELWGRLFEIYAVDLLKQFYPRASGILNPDLQYETGQVDALLDFGDVVVVFEIKSSLLTEKAKRSGSKPEFVADHERKFVRNATGAPKALLQLAGSCKAVEGGRISTATKPARIYPVCVSDEPAIESLFFNSYSNEIFQRELFGTTRIQPVTMMSINEFEEILPYVSDNSFSWPELLDSRFEGTAVRPFSVHQAIYDLLRARDLQPRRNQAIRKSFDEVWKIIGSRYKPPAAQ